jgi:demethylmenaquinone methyltransferase/2-methoxy-6-polyprenyl-1,4-benzoquinol methylase
MPEPRAVRSMFARIAGRYDLLNRTLSGGMDQRWRRRVARRLAPLGGRTAVDVACGTGDLALELARGGARVIGLDFTFEMLARGPHKARAAARRRADGRALDATWVHGDALRLPLPDASMDVVTIAFGLRNVESRAACLVEFARALRPGGRLVVLECGLPRNRVLGALFRGYFTQVLPRLGGLVSGDRAAYEYLPATVLAWPGPDELAAEIGAAGFTDARFESLSGGVAYLHSATRR